MEIKDLLEDANDKLYQGLSKYFNIILAENQDWRAEVWVSSIEGKNATISYCETDFPKAAFAHELLHLDLQAKGFKKIVAGISLDKDIQPHIPTWIKCLDNAFQHHKMANAFLAMGYRPEQFYGDDDGADSTAKFLLDALQESGHSLVSISLLYLIFREPLVEMKAAEKQAIQKAFEEYEGGKFRQNFIRMDEIIHDWIHDASYDAESYMIACLRNAAVTDSWFSYEHDLPGMYSEKFPACGFFTGSPFSLADINKTYGW